MTDTTDENETKNPFIENEGENPDTREEAYWDMNDEDVLYDAYLMLRHAGYSRDELEPLALLIERTTIYNRDSMEMYYDEFLS